MIAHDIIDGAHDEDLDAISEAVRTRKAALASRNAVQLVPGDVVTISDAVRPRYLAGLRVTVEKRNTASVTVRIHEDDSPVARRYGVGRFRLPFSLIAPT